MGNHSWRYSYKANLIGVEGDSLILEVDLGFRMYTKIKSKLYGIKIEDAEKFATWANGLIGRRVVVTTHMHKRNKMGRVLVSMIVDGQDASKFLMEQGIAIMREDEEKS